MSSFNPAFLNRFQLISPFKLLSLLKFISPFNFFIFFYYTKLCKLKAILKALLILNITIFYLMSHVIRAPFFLVHPIDSNADNELKKESWMSEFSWATRFSIFYCCEKNETEIVVVAFLLYDSCIPFISQKHVIIFHIFPSLFLAYSLTYL